MYRLTWAKWTLILSSHGSRRVWTNCWGIDGDVVVKFVFNLLENTQFPDPKEMQMNLTGFLNGKNARIFMQELWDLLASAQENIGGIPSIFLEQKKEEIRQKKVGLYFSVYGEKWMQCKYILVCVCWECDFSVRYLYCCLVFQDPSEYWVRHSIWLLSPLTCVL